MSTCSAAAAGGELVPTNRRNCARISDVSPSHGRCSAPGSSTICAAGIRSFVMRDFHRHHPVVRALENQGGLTDGRQDVERREPCTPRPGVVSARDCR